MITERDICYDFVKAHEFAINFENLPEEITGWLAKSAVAIEVIDQSLPSAFPGIKIAFQADAAGHVAKALSVLNSDQSLLKQISVKMAGSYVHAFTIEEGTMEMRYSMGYLPYDFGLSAPLQYNVTWGFSATSVIPLAASGDE